MMPPSAATHVGGLIGNSSPDLDGSPHSATSTGGHSSVLLVPATAKGSPVEASSSRQNTFHFSHHPNHQPVSHLTQQPGPSRLAHQQSHVINLSTPVHGMPIIMQAGGHSGRPPLDFASSSLYSNAEMYMLSDTDMAGRRAPIKMLSMPEMHFVGHMEHDSASAIYKRQATDSDLMLLGPAAFGTAAGRC